MVVVVFVRTLVVLVCLLWGFGYGNEGAVGVARAETPSPSDPVAATDKFNALMNQYGRAMGANAYLAAAQISRRLFELQSKTGGADSAMAQVYQSMWAVSLMLAGDLVGAKKLYREQLIAIERANGADSAEVLLVLQQLKNVALMQANLDDFEVLAVRAMALTKVLHGEKSSQFAQQWFERGDKALMNHESSAALQAYAQGLKIFESLASSKTDAALIAPLERLAYGYWTFGEQTKAIALSERAWAIAQTVPNLSVYEKASKQIALSDWYAASGQNQRALAVAQRALTLSEAQIARLEKSGSDEAQLRVLLAQAAMINLQKIGNYGLAEQQLRKEIALAIKAHERSGYVAILAGLKREQGNSKEALDLLVGEQGVLRKSAAAHNFDVAIADLLHELGEAKRAEKVLDGLRVACSKVNVGCAVDARSVVNLYAAVGNVVKAEQTLTDWLNAAERELISVLKGGTETDHRIYFERHASVLNSALSFHYNYAAKSRSATRLALTTLLRRKGRILDAATIASGVLRANADPQDKAVIDDLNSARTQLAKLVVTGAIGLGDAEYAKQVAALEDRVRQLELQLATKNAAYRTLTQSVNLADVQKAIPKDARLVEFSSFEPWASKSWQMSVVPNSSHVVGRPRRYVAFVVGRSGEASAIDLGETVVIDEAISRFRAAVKDPDNDSAVQLGKVLHDLTMAKIEPALGGVANVLLAPDGALNLVPFAALVDNKGEYLVKRFNFTYLTSGRDLVRKGTASKAKGGVVFADPAFDSGAPTVQTSKSRGRRSLTMATMHWARLPATAKEADALQKTMGELTIFRGAAATEGQLKQVHRPRILHIATHGFFLPDQLSNASTSGAMVRGESSGASAVENPLLRSGLALAGANTLSSANDDGVLTAFEAAGLDLSGTKLVVLSACETGLGKISNSDGVYGLRRAFGIAGAESILMSLWQVDDVATKDLMAGYYSRLRVGEPRSAALRAVQLELAGRSKYSHPYYWAAFFPAGATTSLGD